MAEMPVNENELSDHFIWYHAPERLKPALLAWVALVRHRFDIEGELYLRGDVDDDGRLRFTFMEWYRQLDRQTAEAIEALASRQPWHAELGSPRRSEAFERISE